MNKLVTCPERVRLAKDHERRLERYRLAVAEMVHSKTEAEFDNAGLETERLWLACERSKLDWIKHRESHCC